MRGRERDKEGEREQKNPESGECKVSILRKLDAGRDRDRGGERQRQRETETETDRERERAGGRERVESAAEAV